MWKHIASNAMTLGILVIIALAGLITWGKAEYTAPGPLAAPIFFEVPRGASLGRVSRDLEAEGAISSAAVFRIGAQYTERADDLKFGNYEIPAGASMVDVLDIVTAGGPSTFRYTATYIVRSQGGETRVRERVPGTGEEIELATFRADEAIPVEYQELVDGGTPFVYRVSIAPGLTSWQIVEGLKGAEFLTGDVDIVPAEGSLAPETFEVSRGTARAEVIERMKRVQERVLAEVWALRRDDLPISTPEEMLILASIIEKETGVPSERRTVAGVFTNRLRQGMRLQTDPTVIYGITKGQGVLGRGLRQSELRRRTEYNTYLIPALPPGPIANPSRASLEAAVDPEATDYIFFVADGTGGHAFAETLSQHNQNVAAWRKIEAERADQ